MLDDWGLCVARGGTAGGSRRKREGPRYAGGRRSGRELPAEPIPCYRRQTYSPSAFEGFVKKNRIQRERGKRAGGKNRAEVYASTNNYSILQFSSSSAITARVIRCRKSRPRNFLLHASPVISWNGVNWNLKKKICPSARSLDGRKTRPFQRYFAPRSLLTALSFFSYSLVSPFSLYSPPPPLILFLRLLECSVLPLFACTCY